MDKEYAKFILQSYRPDGADASNPDFAEALNVAAEDRELSLWLAQERAHDAMFAEALMSVNIPDGLRDEIFAVMDDGRAGKDLSSEWDGLFIGAMASVTPPQGLRDQIISAMEIERGARDAAENNVEMKAPAPFPMRWLNMAAIAAVLILSAIFIFPGLSRNGAANDQLKLAQLQLSSGKFLNTSYEVGVSENNIDGVKTWLTKEGMPVGDTLPKGLISCDVKGGCKLTLDNGVQASMISFENTENGKFYLIIIDINSVEDTKNLANLSQVKLKKCKNCPYTQFNISSWKDDANAYLLLTKSDKKILYDLF